MNTALSNSLTIDTSSAPDSTQSANQSSAGTTNVQRAIAIYLLSGGDGIRDDVAILAYN